MWACSMRRAGPARPALSRRPNRERCRQCRPERKWRPSSAADYAPASARSIITDPGQDDAVAILVALASPDEIEVLAITAVAGNVPIDLTVVNSLALVELADRADVPVYRGADRPMVNELVTAEYVHGPTGLDDPQCTGDRGGADGNHDAS